MVLLMITIKNMKAKEIKVKILTINKYLHTIRPYLVDLINEHKNQNESKIQLTAAINFISSKPDFYETRIMPAKVIT